ncbi:hypothetical protein ACFL3N_01640 [Candidatus Omnitrophota bacterium]
MMKTSRILIISAFAVAVMFFSSGAAQAVFQMDMDSNLVDFRTMDNGESRELADQGVFHNQFSCTSDNDRTWYFKSRLVRSFSSMGNTIPDENFRWKVVSKGEGKGIVTNNVNTENQFTKDDRVIYTSAETDNTGTQVDLQLRYLLTIPKRQLTGSYDAIVRFTMIETP